MAASVYWGIESGKEAARESARIRKSPAGASCGQLEGLGLVARSRRAGRLLARRRWRPVRLAARGQHGQELSVSTNWLLAERTRVETIWTRSTSPLKEQLARRRPRHGGHLEAKSGPTSRRTGCDWLVAEQEISLGLLADRHHLVALTLCRSGEQ